MAPPYDTNCVSLAKEKKWITNYDEKQGYLRSYNQDLIKNGFDQTQTKLKTQVQAWQAIDGEIDCLNKVAGIKFTNGELIIENFEKFQSFRLNKSQINCVINPNYIEYKSSKGLSVYPDVTYANDTPSSVAKLPKNFNEESEYQKNQRKKGHELNNLVTQLQTLGDLGFENYCAHQLYLGSANDKAQTLKTAFDNCHQARKSGNSKLLQSNACTGYPDYFINEIPKVEKMMDDITKDMGSSGYQPVVKLNEVDNKIYSQFANNREALKKAREQAKEDSHINAHDYENLRAQNLVKDAKDMVDCGGENLWTDQLQKGIDSSTCENDISLFYEMEPGFNASLRVIKQIHRNRLISEMNIQTYVEAMKAKYYTLDPATQAEVLQNPEKLCPKIIPIEKERDRFSLCTGSMLTGFKKAISDIQMNPQKHFFSLDLDEVINDYNSTLKQISIDCASKRKHFEKGGLSGPDYLKYKDALNSKIEDGLKKIRSHPAAAYLYTDAIGEKIMLDKYNPEYHVCGEEYDGVGGHLIYPTISKDDLVKARKEFSDLIDKQFQVIVDNRKDDRGGHSNQVGAWACGVDMKEKEDLYVLNQFYYSHPYMMGKVLQKVDPLEKGVYNAMTCEAIECDASVEARTDAIVSGIKIASMALGPIGTGSVGVGVSAFGSYRKWDEANKNIDLTKLGAATSGLEHGFHDEIAQYLKDNEFNADWANHAVDITAEIITTAFGVGVKGVGKDKLKFGPMPKINESMENYFKEVLGKAELDDFEKNLISTITSTTLSKVKTISTKSVNGNIEFKDVLPSVKEVIIGMSVLRTGKAQEIFGTKNNFKTVTSLSEIPYSNLEGIDDPALQKFLASEYKNRAGK